MSLGKMMSQFKRKQRKRAFYLSNVSFKYTKQWRALFIKTVHSCCLLLLLSISCYFRMLAPTDKCGKGACGSPHQSSNLSHNGLLCPPHLPPALFWALHRVGIVLNKVTVALGRLTSLDSNSRHIGGVTSWDKRPQLPLRYTQAECRSAGPRPELPGEVIASHEMQLSFKNLAAWWISDVFKIDEILSGGQIIDEANELALAGTKPS